MSIRFACSNSQCAQPVRAPDENAGQRARCPQCGTVQRVPAPPEVGGDVFELSALAVGEVIEASPAPAPASPNPAARTGAPPRGAPAGPMRARAERPRPVRGGVPIEPGGNVGGAAAIAALAGVIRSWLLPVMMNRGWVPRSLNLTVVAVVLAVVVGVLIGLMHRHRQWIAATVWGAATYAIVPFVVILGWVVAQGGGPLVTLEFVAHVLWLCLLRTVPVPIAAAACWFAFRLAERVRST